MSGSRVFHRSRANYADAAREYERAIALTPDNAPVRGILAGMYMFLGRYDDALRECRQSLELVPSYITYVTLGMTHYRMRKFDDAVAALERASTLLEDFRTVGNLARAHYWAGRRDRARDLFENAIRLGEREIGVNPRSDEVHVALADYYARAWPPRRGPRASRPRAAGQPSFHVLRRDDPQPAWRRRSAPPSWLDKAPRGGSAARRGYADGLTWITCGGDGASTP